MRPLTADTWGKEERAAVMEVLDSKRVTMGKKTQEFEEAYADYVGTRYCVACNSGSSANLLMVAAYTYMNGSGTVLVPAVGWATSYSPFYQYGWKMLFVDIDKETLQYDMRMMQAACRYNKVDLILGINLLGSVNQYDQFPDLPVLEDNCESMGAELYGKRAGSFGVMASHSTYYSHHLCTMEGGMVTTNDRAYYEMLLSLRSHGWTRHLPKDNVLGAEVAPFHFIFPGYNVRPTDMQCAIGLAQLKKLDRFIEQRRDNADRFPCKKQKEIGDSSWFGFAVFGEDRERFKDFETRPIVTGNFLRQPVIRYYEHDVFGETPNADFVHDHGIMVGNSHERIDW